MSRIKQKTFLGSGLWNEKAANRNSKASFGGLMCNKVREREKERGVGVEVATTHAPWVLGCGFNFTVVCGLMFSVRQ